MTDPEAALGALVQDALAAEFGAEYAGADPLIRPSGFADFQSNAAMSLSKKPGPPPRDIAGPVAARIWRHRVPWPAPRSAGPASSTSRCRDELDRRPGQPRSSPTRASACSPADPAQRIVVDYSGPNVAKELHAGHLRATVVGDAIARVLEHLGHDGGAGRPPR